MSESFLQLLRCRLKKIKTITPCMLNMVSSVLFDVLSICLETFNLALPWVILSGKYNIVILKVISSCVEIMGFYMSVCVIFLFEWNRITRGPSTFQAQNKKTTDCHCKNIPHCNKEGMTHINVLADLIANTTKSKLTLNYLLQICKIFFLLHDLELL